MEWPPVGRCGTDLFRRSGGLHVAVAIGEAHDGVGVAHVDPLRIGAARIEGDSERLVQAGGEDRNLLRLAVLVAAAEDFDLAQVGFGDEEVAVGGGADLARLIEIGGV